MLRNIGQAILVKDHPHRSWNVHMAQLKLVVDYTLQSWIARISHSLSIWTTCINVGMLKIVS